MSRSCHALALTILFEVMLVASAVGQAKHVRLSGWVVDSACAYTKGIDRPVSAACARACAKGGSPLVILREDGTIFVPISDTTPASSQNAKLLPFAGEQVVVTGKDYVRNGSHGLAIATIERAKR